MLLFDFLGALADVKALVGLGATVGVLSAAGAVPRVGFIRGISLGWKNFIFGSISQTSVRNAEINTLMSRVKNLKNGGYVVVIGGKGNGKSCLIDTALHRRFGVIKLSTQSGATKDVIVNQVMREITGIRVNMYDLTANAQRTLFFYKWFFPPAVVVLRVPERQQREEYAQITAAVRFLADELKLSPIIDGSPNSIPPEVLTTKRELIIVVEPMRKEQLSEIEELKAFLAFLKEHHLNDAVWKVLGGVPAHYLTMQSQLEFPAVLESQRTPDEIIDSVVKYMMSTLSDAFNKEVLMSSPMTESIIKVFREHKVSRITWSELKELGLQIEYPNKVFRGMKTPTDWLVVPATNAVGLIITEGIKSGKDIEALVEKLVARH